MEAIKLNKLRIKILVDALGKPVMNYQKLHQTSKILKLSNKKTINPKVQLKEYIRLEKFILDKSDLDQNIKSIRLHRKNFGSRFDLDLISTILFLSGGLKRIENGFSTSFHLYKGQYAVEVYLYSIDSELPVGFYHYNPLNHSLDILPFKKEQNFKNMLKSLNNAKIVIFITGVFDRLVSLTGDRGYNLVLKQTGYLSQNIRTNAALYGVESNIVEDFVSNYIESSLELDSSREAVLEVINLN